MMVGCCYSIWLLAFWEIFKVVDVRSNPKTQATVVRLHMTNEQMMPTLLTTLEAAACKMEGSTNAAQENLGKADQG